MDFLSQIALPQSLEHITVLHFVLNFVNIFFIPFISVLLGLAGLSLYHNFMGRKYKQPIDIQFAKDSIGIIFANRNILLLLGVIPYLSIVFAYSQLLQGSGAVTSQLLLWGFLSFSIGLFFINSYYFNFKVSTYLDLIQGNKEAAEYRQEVLSAHLTAGKWGMFFAVIGVYFLSAAIDHAGRPSAWANANEITVLFSFGALIKFLLLCSYAIAISGIAVPFFMFVWQGGNTHLNDEYALFIRKQTTSLALIGLLVIPVFFVLQTVTAEKIGLSSVGVFASVSAILFAFVTMHAVYGMLKDFRKGYAANAMYLIFFMFFFGTIAEQALVSHATRLQSATIAHRYDKYHSDLLTSMGISLTVINGEDIYNGKCSACHLFGDKKIGPAYKNVLPKYENDRAKLVSFILNPQKIDPAYPPMPNQGLKPAEADSIASYILRKYKE